MKIIFLDVDGVLNHWNNKKSHNEQKKYRSKFGYHYDFNYINVRWVKKFLSKAIKNNYKIIISSSWRDSEEGIYAIKFILGKYISSNIIGRTGEFRNSNNIFNGRELEIIDSIKSNKYLVHSIIIDDEVSFSRMKGVTDIIETNTRKGFRRKHYKLGIKYLNKINFVDRKGWQNEKKEYVKK